MLAKPDIDISENRLRQRGNILSILLKDNSKTNKRKSHNIIWATDSYKNFGKTHSPKKPILPEQVTGINGRVIQPRAAKSKDEQKHRTKNKAEVFTPLKIVKQMNDALDEASPNYPINKDNWQAYVAEKRLEITCGEGPFIAGRYNPTANTGVVIKPENRVGFLDRKLQAIGRFIDDKKEWLEYAEKALKASYGYEWQGDNLLIARENVLLTIDDFYKAKFDASKGLTTKKLEELAEIVAWNIWQMDGLRYVIPMSCRHETKIVVGYNTLFEEIPDRVEKNECEGCKFNRPLKHNGKYAKIMDWEKGKAVKFVRLLGEG